MDLRFLQRLKEPADTKILLLVLDGLGGLPRDSLGLTELEAANTPHLDQLASRSICGLHQPVGPGITPGSGPSHLALFGYDPITYQVGRGVLSALGIDFDLHLGDVAARGNFCTLDDRGRVADRRAGRISTGKNEELCQKLRAIELEGAQLFIETVKEYRFLMVLRGEGLSGELEDTDPQDVGEMPLRPVPRVEHASKTAELVESFVRQAQEVLREEHPANMVLLRGFSKRPDWPTVGQVFGLKAAAIANYPMYRGVAKLVGMEPLDTGATLQEEISTLKEHWQDYDFFYVHVKPIDSAGEDGDFDRKVALIEEVDSHIPAILDLQPEVLIVTGDHSTPASLRFHSWHPVPVLIWSNQCRADEVQQFGERSCMEGGLGANLPAPHMMPIAMANAGRLAKFGA